MLDKQLASSLGLPEHAVPDFRLDEFARLASQTSLAERESLYAAARHAYTQEGEVWDIGCAAGGSSFCLAAGMQDKPPGGPVCRVKCFDLFGGYSARTFDERFAQEMDDIDIFHAQTRPVSEYVTAVKMDLTTDLDAYALERPVELAHIDAAKSLTLWRAIFGKISAAIIPGRTIWIFQDFERARLPWQVYSLAAMMSVGNIIGGARYGTVYFRFSSDIGAGLRRKIIDDDFTMRERADNVRRVFDMIRDDHMSLFPEAQIRLGDIENTVLAYCHYWKNDIERAQKILRNTSPEYLSHPGNAIYSQEIFGINGV